MLRTGCGKQLRQLAELLPDLVAEAVACPEEPNVGHPGPGDLEIRFRPKGLYNVGDLNCAIELRTKLYASRLETKQNRAELWLVLADGWWTQT